LPGSSFEREQVRAKEVAGDVVVQRTLVRRHGVFEQLGATSDEGLFKELLCLTPECSMYNDRQAPSQFELLLAGDVPASAVLVEQGFESRLVAQQRARRIDVLDQAPELRERVLDRRGRQQQHRRGANRLTNVVSILGVRARVEIQPVPVKTLIDAREYLVRL